MGFFEISIFCWCMSNLAQSFRFCFGVNIFDSSQSALAHLYSFHHMELGKLNCNFWFVSFHHAANNNNNNDNGNDDIVCIHTLHLYLGNSKMVSRDFYANQIIRLFCSLLLMHRVAYSVALSFIIHTYMHLSECVTGRHAIPRIYYLNVSGTFAIKWRWNYTNSNELPNDHVRDMHTHTNTLIQTHTHHEQFKANKAIKSYYSTT